MNTYGKILLTTLFSLFAIVGTTYHFTRTALIDLGETWLDTRLSEAMVIVISQEQMLHEYGLADITASIAKAKMDTAVEIANIGVGKMGYIFGVTRDGFIVFHPDKKMVDTYVGDTTWFKALRNKTKTRQLVMDMNQEPSLARFAYFKPWEWYVLAVDPMQEIYGVASRMRPYLYAMGGVAALIISLALMLLTRRLTKPLKELVQGTEKIGKGDLDTRIPIQSKDEFGHLAKQFNQMAFRLKETLTALQYSEEHFRALTENASDLIWILDAQGNFKYISPSTKRILGYDPDLLMEKNAFDFLHPEDRSSAHNRFQKRIQGTLPEQTTEQRFRHQDNSYCTLESISKNLLNHPAVQGVVINSRDITQRKIAEQALKRSHQELETRVVERTRNLTLLNQALNNEILVRKQKEVELKKANQAKSEFLANISHEIRTPLNSVIGFSEVLSTMVTDTQQKNYLQAITTAGKHLLVLITNILDLSKIEAGKLAIKKTTVSLDTLFREIHHLFRIKLAHKGIKFLIQIDENMPDYLILDDMRLRQVLTNLVENAVKFTEKGQISLLARINAGSSPETVDLMIQVRDTGIGIPEDKHQLIFESFEQENADINRKYGGTGLGLAISRQLVELMQGHISLDSHPGRGSTFTILLPQVAVSFVKKTSPHSSDRSLPDITVAAPVPVLSPAVFRQALNRYPDLAPLVKTKILPLLPGTQGGVKISDARDIAENIMEMGRQFDLVMFRTFGEDLMQHAEVFDIEKIALCLDQLSGILKEMDTG